MPLWKKNITKQLGSTARWIWRWGGWWRGRIHLRRIGWIQDETEEVVLRWWRNRTGRPLSPSQIHQKNISTLSKFHKRTSECWQRTSGTQKSRSLSSKTGRKKYKRRKKRQRRWGGSSVLGREACPGKGILRREVSKHQETLSLPSLCEPWKHRGQHNRKEK